MKKTQYPKIINQAVLVTTNTQLGAMTKAVSLYHRLILSLVVVGYGLKQQVHFNYQCTGAKLK